MAVNGLISALDEYEIYLSSSASGSHSGDGTGSYSHSASGQTLFTPDTIYLVPGISLDVSGSSVPDTWTVTYTGPGAPFGASWSGSGWASADGRVVLSNVRVYNLGGSYKVQFDVKVYAGGVLKLSTSFADTSGGMGPAYVNLLAVPFGFSGNCGAGTVGLPTYADCDPFDYSSTANATASGGWRTKAVGAGGYDTYPISLISTGTIISGTNTYDMQVSSYSYNRSKRTVFDEYYCDYCELDSIDPGTGAVIKIPGKAVIPFHFKIMKSEGWSKSKSGALRGIPDLTKAIKRFNSDFGALVYRTKMPQTKATSSSTSGGVTSSTTSEIHPFQDQILSLLKSGACPIEDTLGYHSYPDHSWGNTDNYSYSYSNCIPPVVTTCDITSGAGTRCKDIPAGGSDNNGSAFSFPTYVGPSSNMAGYLGHQVALARYFSSWCNPHWSYALYTKNWDIDGSPETWNDYWQNVGSQWLYDAALPGVDQHRTRNHLVSEPLQSDGNSPFLDTFFGGFRWVGVSRWQTKACTPRATYTYTNASSSLWSSADGTLSFGSGGVTLSPTGSPTPVKIRLKLGSFSVEPYQWVHLADRILVNWTDSNISTCKVYLVGNEGSRVILNDNNPNAFKDKPVMAPTKYAGSWAQDFGAGITTDFGTDDQTYGESATVMGNAELACAIQLLADRTATYLEFEIVPVNPANPVTVKWPRFDYTKSTNRAIYPENANQTAIIHPTGPGVRTGIWNTGIGNSINLPPTVLDPTFKPDLPDWLATERMLVEGIAGDSGVTTELTNLYDSFEGQSIGQNRNNSGGFWLPNNGGTDWQLALLNTMSEIPPLCAFPRKARGTVTWLASGAFVQESWIWAQESSYLISASEAMSEVVSGSTWSTVLSAPLGWNIADARHALDNTETGAKITSGSRNLATVRPWRGFYAVIGEEILTSLGVWNLQTSDGLFLVSGAMSTGTYVRRWDYFLPLGTSMVSMPSTGAGYYQCRVYEDNRNQITAILSRLNAGTLSLERCYSNDGGKTWSAPSTVAITNGKYLTGDSSNYGDLIEAAQVPDSGTSGPGVIKISYRSAGESSWPTAVSAKSGGTALKFKDTSFHIRFSNDAAGRVILTANIDGETDSSNWFSTDVLSGGCTFTRFT